MTDLINKSMDRNDLLTDDASIFITEISRLIETLHSKGQKISSWYGEFDLSRKVTPFEKFNRGFNYQPLSGFKYDVDFPWFLMWEMFWLYRNNSYKSGETLLDLGGSSSLFSYFLASKGMRVTTVDLQSDLVSNGNAVAASMGWDLQNHVMDMRELTLSEEFDHITSVCVFEHIPLFDRVKINKRMTQLLKNGGTFSITFDYKNPSKAAEINSPTDIYKQFIEPSGLKLRGNVNFFDNNSNYLLHPFFHPKASLKLKMREILAGHFAPGMILRRKKMNDYSFGSLFMVKD